MPQIFVTDIKDARLDDYRNLKDNRLAEDGGKFIAESEGVVRQLIASALAVHSVLVTTPRLDALSGVLPPALPVYVAAQSVMDQVAGFHVHRGCLAVGARPANARIPDDARTVLVLEDLVDVDNLGALVRNAAAFGADAILVSPRCADPFYRKAIRVSMGSVFHLPIVRSQDWPADLLELRRRRGLTLVGAVLGHGAVPLSSYRRPAGLALLLGAEGPGLAPGTRKLCDALVTIPMAAQRANSLNVATAGAVFLYHLMQAVDASAPTT